MNNKESLSTKRADKFDMKEAQDNVGKHKTFFYRCIDSWLPITEQFIKNKRYFNKKDLEIFKFADKEWISKALNKYWIKNSSSEQFTTVENSSQDSTDKAKKSSKPNKKNTNNDKKTTDNETVQNSSKTVHNSPELDSLKEEINSIKEKMKEQEQEKEKIHKEYKKKIDNINDDKIKKVRKYKWEIKAITEDKEIYRKEVEELRKEVKNKNRLVLFLAILATILITFWATYLYFFDKI